MEEQKLTIIKFQWFFRRFYGRRITSRQAAVLLAFLAATIFKNSARGAIIKADF